MTFNITNAAAEAKNASRQVAKLSAQQKVAVLLKIAQQLRVNVPMIMQANQEDLLSGQKNGLSDAMLDRLKLDEERIEAIAQAVENIAQQKDPVGSVSKIERLPSGIEVGKMRIPLGVIAMIYESRPNVTVDAAALCFKAGNAVVLRGGKEALQSNLVLASCIHEALDAHDIDRAAVTVIPDPSREIMNDMLTLNQSIDLIIPRGGEGLIRFVSENSRIPVIQHYKGVCHLYVDKAADITKALNLLENGKTQRTGVCNALETLLVHADIANEFLPLAAALLSKHDVVVHACESSISFFENPIAANEADWDAEYLALEIAVKVVPSMEAAISHIEKHGSGHTEVIATQDYSRGRDFIKQVDSSVVMVNASSRFSDGGELGLGAEIGISTSKLHAYGPMGVESLTTEKFVVYGDGEIRG